VRERERERYELSYFFFFGKKTSASTVDWSVQWPTTLLYTHKHTHTHTHSLVLSLQQLDVCWFVICCHFPPWRKHWSLWYTLRSVWLPHLWGPAGTFPQPRNRKWFTVIVLVSFLKLRPSLLSQETAQIWEHENIKRVWGSHDLCLLWLRERERERERGLITAHGGFVLWLYVTACYTCRLRSVYFSLIVWYYQLFFLLLLFNINHETVISPIKYLIIIIIYLDIFFHICWSAPVCIL